MKSAIIVTGIPQIDRRLKTLAPRIQKKVVRKAIRDGIKVVASEVKTQVPVDTGLTKANVKVRAVKKKKRGVIEIEVKIGGDPGLYRKTAKGTVFYPAIVEYKKNPFMRRSFVAKAEPARQKAITEILEGVEREASKG
jgi:HK97 gp10 family phage protein